MQIWLNDGLVDADEAAISPFDRGFLFGDGVYEVVRYFNGRPVGLDAHIKRMADGLSATKIAGFDAGRLKRVGEQLIKAEGLSDALVYVQVTRGAEGHVRRHVPESNTSPTVFGFAEEAPPLEALVVPNTITCILSPDDRWHRCEIKSISLLGNLLPALKLEEADADEAILHRGGYVSEGSRSNVFAVLHNWLVTPPAGTTLSILHGVTRAMAIEAAKNVGLRVDERPLRVEELKRADEVFITSTRRLMSAVVRLNDHPVGTETIGPTTQRIFDRLRADVASSCKVKLAGARAM